MQNGRVEILIECDSSELAPFLQEAANKVSANPNFKIIIKEIIPSAMSKEEFQTIRKQSKLNQHQFAYELGMSQGHVSAMERGAFPISQEIADTAKDILIKYTKPKERKERK